MVGSSPGLTQSRYQVIKHLASGGMAKVLLARATGIEGFERYVVMKQIHVERARDPMVVKAFIEEARVSALLHHHNIVQVTDIGQDNGEYFIAMEYVHGEDARSLLTHVSKQRQRIPLGHVLTIVISVASALHYAHELRGPDRQPLQIVHRDVSPANILVGYDGTVKVVDFGIAKAAQRSIATESGSLKGKIAYMPPEQCLGLPVDRRSDVFSLGIVLYELYCVRRLFKRGTDFLTMNAVVQSDFKPPSHYRPDIPPELEAIMLKALAQQPNERFQTADELRLALQKFATTAKIQTSTTELADYMIEQFGRRPEPWLPEAVDQPIAANADFEDPDDVSEEKPASLRLPTGIPTPASDSLFSRLRRSNMPAPRPFDDMMEEEATVVTDWATATDADGAPVVDDPSVRSAGARAPEPMERMEPAEPAEPVEPAQSMEPAESMENGAGILAPPALPGVEPSSVEPSSVEPSSVEPSGGGRAEVVTEPVARIKPRPRWVPIAGIAVAFAALGIVVIVISGGAKRASKQKTTPTEAPAAEPAEAVPPTPEPTEEPTPAAASGSNSDAETGSGSDATATLEPDDPIASSKPAAKTKKPPPKKQRKFDPKSLFPK